MRAGKLDKRVTILRVTVIPDGGGGDLETWAEAGKRWAGFKPVEPRVRAEQLAGGAQVAPTAGVVTFRADALTAGLGIDDRLSFDGREWNVREVQPPTRFGAVFVAVESE